MYSLAAQRIVLFVGYLFNSNAICHGTLHHTHRVGNWMCGLSLGLYTYIRHRIQSFLCFVIKFVEITRSVLGHVPLVRRTAQRTSCAISLHCFIFLASLVRP